LTIIVKNDLNFELHPVVQALNIIGDKWIILILQQAFLGNNRFNQLKEFTGASKGTLTKRLDFLIKHNMMRKHAYSEKSLRYEYRLTSKTLGLYPWALAVWKWEVQWNSSSLITPCQLVHHKGCHHELQPVVICKHCKEPLHLNDIERDYMPVSISESDLSVSNKPNNFRSSTLENESQSYESIVDIMGDRWNPMIIACCNFGYSRYDDFYSLLGIASNILSDRLKKLTDMGVLSKVICQKSRKRHEYILSEKGKSLYQLTMVLRQWALDALPPLESPFIIKHKNCCHDVEVAVVCSWCKEEPQANEVSFIFA
jgi:DNA-binding HxlR family transcriptional regulator